MHKIYIINKLELDGKYSIYQLNQLDDNKYKEYVKEHGNVYSFMDFSLLILNGVITIPFDNNERNESISYRIL